jgi:hypothetical protein
MADLSNPLPTRRIPRNTFHPASARNAQSLIFHILRSGYQAKIGLSVIQSVTVNVVNLHSARGTHYKAMH